MVQAKTKVKRKDNTKVQNKESVCKDEKAKCKCSDQNKEAPKTKKIKESEKEETVSNRGIEQSRVQAITPKEPTETGPATIAIPVEDYKSLIEFVR